MRKRVCMLSLVVISSILLCVTNKLNVNAANDDSLLSVYLNLICNEIVNEKDAREANAKFYDMLISNDFSYSEYYTWDDLEVEIGFAKELETEDVPEYYSDDAWDGFFVIEQGVLWSSDYCYDEKGNKYDIYELRSELYLDNRTDYQRALDILNTSDNVINQYTGSFYTSYYIIDSSFSRFGDTAGTIEVYGDSEPYIKVTLYFTEDVDTKETMLYFYDYSDYNSSDLFDMVVDEDAEEVQSEWKTCSENMSNIYSDNYINSRTTFIEQVILKGCSCYNGYDSKFCLNFYHNLVYDLDINKKDGSFKGTIEMYSAVPEFSEELESYLMLYTDDDLAVKDFVNKCNDYVEDRTTDAVLVTDFCTFRINKDEPLYYLSIVFDNEYEEVE